MAKYYTLVTDVGRAKMANAQVMGEKVSFSQIALGSSETKPRENQTTLGKEEWRGPISNVSLDKDNPNWIVVEAVVPSHVGGFEIAEVGVYDEEGHLIVVGNHPKTYKPKMDEGTTKDVAIRIIIEVSNSEIVELKVDPSVVIATRSYVESAIELAMASIDFSTVEKQIDQHVSNADIHVTAKDKSNWNAKETPSAAQQKATKALNDAKAYTDNRLQQIKSDSTTSSSSDTLATSKAVKTVMDRANEAFTSADNGKKAIRQAIIGVDDGVNVPTNPSFDELAKAIGGISTGVKFAEGVSNLIYGDYHEDFRDKVLYIEISGLDFEPELLLAVGMGKQYRVLEVTYIYHKGGVKYNDEGEIEYTEMRYNTNGRANRIKKKSGTVSFGYFRANLGIITDTNLVGEPIKWVAIGGLSE